VAGAGWPEATAFLMVLAGLAALLARRRFCHSSIG